MNIYIAELKAYRKSTLIWSIVMVFLVLAGVGKYTAGTMAGGDIFNDMMKDMPKSLQGLFGVGVFDLSKLVDYYGVLYLYLALVLSIQAVMLGNGIIAKEERDKTAEYLLVKPISRAKVITSKLTVALTILIILNTVTYICSYFVFVMYSKGESYGTPLFKLMVGLFALQLIFMLFGASLAAGIGNYKLSSSLATGILLLMFFVTVILDITGRYDFLKYLTFFKYFDAKYILKGGYPIMFLPLAALLGIIFVVTSYTLYKRRDMNL